VESSLPVVSRSFAVRGAFSSGRATRERVHRSACFVYRLFFPSGRARRGSLLATAPDRAFRTIRSSRSPSPPSSVLRLPCPPSPSDLDPDPVPARTRPGRWARSAPGGWGPRTPLQPPPVRRSTTTHPHPPRHLWIWPTSPPAGPSDPVVRPDPVGPDLVTLTPNLCEPPHPPQTPGRNVCRPVVGPKPGQR
jgi:hypothetical protein